MSGPSRLSTRDLERLSAYLDGQLAPGEAAGLEARLQDDSALRETLEGLRQTKAALRSLPSLRPPRSFTLTPQMVGTRPRLPPSPAPPDPHHLGGKGETPGRAQRGQRSKRCLRLAQAFESLAQGGVVLQARLQPRGLAGGKLPIQVGRKALEIARG